MCKDTSLENEKKKKKRNIIDDLMKQRERREEKRLTDNCKEAILCFQLCL